MEHWSPWKCGCCKPSWDVSGLGQFPFFLFNEGQLIALCEGSSVEQLLEDREDYFRKEKTGNMPPYAGSWYVATTHRIKCQYQIFYKKEHFNCSLAAHTHPPNGRRNVMGFLFCVEASKQLAQENPAMASTLLELSESFLRSDRCRCVQSHAGSTRRNEGMP